MKRKGFTLIEMLAVIVVIAIIGLIASPLIIGITEKTRKDAFLRSVELIEKATNINVNTKSYGDIYTYTITDGIISDNVQVNNSEGINGTIEYDFKGVVSYAMHNGKYCVTRATGETKSEIKDYDGNCVIPKDKIAPTIIANAYIKENQTYAVITALDETMLSEENIYKYCLSISNIEYNEENCHNYENNVAFPVEKSGKQYLWVYPIKDTSNNVNENRTLGEPYMILELYVYGGLPEYTYTGDSTLIEDGKGSWRIKFLTDGTFTPKTDMIIDAFLVGGGAGGRDTMTNYSEPGGGGGYTKTKTEIEVKKDNQYEIKIGQGGAVNANGTQTEAFGEYANGGKLGDSNETFKQGGDYDMQAGGAGGSGGGGGSARGHGLYGGANGADGGVDGNNGSSGLYEYRNETNITYNWFGGDGGKGQRNKIGSNGEAGSTREFSHPVTKTYIVGKNALASDWLALTSDGEAITPKEGYVYSIMTSGTYYYRDFIWSGTTYVETDIARVYGSGGGAGAAKNGSGGKGYHGAANGTSHSGVKGSATPNTGGGGGGASMSNVTGTAGASGIVVIRNAAPKLDLEYTYTGESEVINDGNGDWRIRFLTSGTFTITKDVEIDVFLVGGGGRGGTYTGGGGGYTNTALKVNISKDTPYEIVIGEGGTSNNGANGKPSKAFTFEAAGGKTPSSQYGGNGGDGGAGGGGYGGPNNNGNYGGNGGENGSDGGSASAGSGGQGQISRPGPNGETGNTREFGEAHGELYSGGGGGSYGSYGGNGGGGNGAINPVAPGTAGATNTGGGGGTDSLPGGSGIVIIRNARNN